MILLVGITGTGRVITRGPFKPTGTHSRPLQKSTDIVSYVTYGNMSVLSTLSFVLY